jgi:hypothetical protein
MPKTVDGHRLAHPPEPSVQAYASVAEVLFLLAMVAGGCGEFYVPTKLIVSGDADCLAENGV